MFIDVYLYTRVLPHPVDMHRLCTDMTVDVHRLYADIFAGMCADVLVDECVHRSDSLSAGRLAAAWAAGSVVPSAL